MHRSTHPDTSRRWVGYLRTFQEFEACFGDEPASSVPTFRLNRRRSNARGMLFHRLAQQAVALGPAPYRQIVATNQPTSPSPRGYVREGDTHLALNRSKPRTGVPIGIAR